LEAFGSGALRRPAVMVYQIESYRYWEQFLGRSDFTFGQFGENFTGEDLGDDQVCIGDRYRINNALFEVTQPRVTCYRVGIRMNEPRIAALLAGCARPIGEGLRRPETPHPGNASEARRAAQSRLLSLRSIGLPSHIHAGSDK
jgi:MOSC domain